MWNVTKTNLFTCGSRCICADWSHYFETSKKKKKKTTKKNNEKKTSGSRQSRKSHRGPPIKQHLCNVSTAVLVRPIGVHYDVFDGHKSAADSSADVTAAARRRRLLRLLEVFTGYIIHPRPFSGNISADAGLVTLRTLRFGLIYIL